MGRRNQRMNNFGPLAPYGVNPVNLPYMPLPASGSQTATPFPPGPRVHIPVTPADTWMIMTSFGPGQLKQDQLLMTARWARRNHYTRSQQIALQEMIHMHIANLHLPFGPHALAIAIWRARLTEIDNRLFIATGLNF